MTLTQILAEAGIKSNQYLRQRIGGKITSHLREKGIKYSKVDEMVKVNDYPDESLEMVKQIIIDHFTKK